MAALVGVGKIQCKVCHVVHSYVDKNSNDRLAS
jgi:hypothetical protein